jgi:ABC-type multidrug transport system fused ATPase/permease subunit
VSPDTPALVIRALMPWPPQIGFELRHEALAARQAVAGGKAVPEREDVRVLGLCAAAAGTLPAISKAATWTIARPRPYGARTSLPGSLLRMAAPYVIDASDVTLSLGRKAARVDILRGLDLQVAAGESVALLGPSGLGQILLMAVLSGMEQPTGGTIRIAGADFHGIGEDALARARRGRIGIVLQAFHLLPTMTRT